MSQNEYEPMPEDAPDIPDAPEAPPHTGEDSNFIGGKRELLSELNNTKVPTDISSDFWHFNSNTLSASFLDDADEKDFENLFWATNEMKMKEYNSSSMRPKVFNNVFQIYLHGKARMKQSKGTKNSQRTNMLTLFTKAIQVIENKMQSSDGSRGKKRFWG